MTTKFGIKVDDKEVVAAAPVKVPATQEFVGSFPMPQMFVPFPASVMPEPAFPELLVPPNPMPEEATPTDDKVFKAEIAELKKRVAHKKGKKDGTPRR